VGTTIITVLVMSKGGLGGGIAFVLAPMTVLLPLAVAVMNWWGFGYLGRPHVVEASAWNAREPGNAIFYQRDRRS